MIFYVNECAFCGFYIYPAGLRIPGYDLRSWGLKTHRRGGLCLFLLLFTEVEVETSD